MMGFVRGLRLIEKLSKRVAGVDFICGAGDHHLKGSFHLQYTAPIPIPIPLYTPNAQMEWNRLDLTDDVSMKNMWHYVTLCDNMILCP